MLAASDLQKHLVHVPDRKESIPLPTHTAGEASKTVSIRGTEVVEYFVFDDTDGFASAFVNITVNPVNDDPDAVDDAVSGPEDALIEGNVLADNTNGPDRDPDIGDILTVSRVNGQQANVGTQITLASGALLMLSADGTFAYDPNEQFDFLAVGESETDSFTYTVSDCCCF